jgi:hypothetical protein
MLKFEITTRPAADGAVWTVLSPGGVSVYRTSSIEDAVRERDERNGVGPIPVGLYNELEQYESGEMGATEAVAFIGRLIQTGLIRGLQGSYGRAAASLVNSGHLSPEGEVLLDVEDA